MGKGRKERLVPMSVFLLKKLFRWVREHDGNLFQTGNGSLLGVSNAQRDLRAMGKKCGVKVGFHQPAYVRNPLPSFGRQHCLSATHPGPFLH